MAPRNVRCEYSGCPYDATYLLWGQKSYAGALCRMHAAAYQVYLMAVEPWFAGLRIEVGVN